MDNYKKIIFHLVNVAIITLGLIIIDMKPESQVYDFIGGVLGTAAIMFVSYGMGYNDAFEKTKKIINEISEDYKKLIKAILEEENGNEQKTDAAS